MDKCAVSFQNNPEDDSSDLQYVIKSQCYALFVALKIPFVIMILFMAFVKETIERELFFVKSININYELFLCELI